ncbi:MAG: hypothetical protein HOU81_25515 [Hamadaea sp.]|uniref:hypothetical protein n=1 Tax=Hamadaea sp. TaxID=2024425 RepID=UPI0017BB86E7|nr:hypothetical protein [Hamadaea sp.]NUR74182.1 hypothetical protein [Hamadaea sp.]NUS45926.1 hypothetical protein [Mycobacteriaceae bacterium]NUT20494.1 hypothetical protein [Hamadaea sp.]
MHHKLQTRAFEQVASILHPGEQPLVATRALVGKFGASRIGTVAAQGLLLEAVGGLGAALTSASKKQFAVLTDRRMIFLSQTFLGGPGGKVLGEVSRDQLALAEAKMGVVSLLRISFGTSGDGVSLTFPRVDKKNAESLATALRGLVAV